MTLFKNNFVEPDFDFENAEEYGKKMFSLGIEESRLISNLSEDDGETICSRSLIMLLKDMNGRICKLETEILQLKGE